MLTKIIAVLLLIAMIVSLFMGMYYLVKDQGKTDRTLKALTWRISIWIILFILLAAGAYTGFLEPSNSIKPDWAKEAESSSQ